MQKIDATASRRSRILVCVDSTHDQELTGRIESPLLGSRKFISVLMMVALIEDFFDRIKFPQRFFCVRSFYQTKRKFEDKTNRREGFAQMEELVMQSQKTPNQEEPFQPGEQATFVVHVRCRQNATWQGHVKWMESGKLQNFRSTLELLSLMEEALEMQSRPEPRLHWQESEHSPHLPRSNRNESGF